MAAPPVFRAVSGPVIRPAHSWAGNGRSQVIQGLFQSRPFSFAAIGPGAIQAKSAIQRRPGVDAFQVDLRPPSGGWPLPRDVQAKMEAALGANFSDVRVHVGPEASAIGALAFTWGSDLHFAPGQYNPHTPHGQFLLGHELAHVVQQRAGRVANPFGSGVAVVQDHALEAEADRLGRMASTSRVHDVGSYASTSFASQNSESTGNKIITRKANPTAQYAARAPQPNGSGWDIQVAVQGTPQPVRDAFLEAEADRLGRPKAMLHSNSSVERVLGREIDAQAQMGAQGTAVNCKLARHQLAQPSRELLTPVPQTGIAPRLPALQTKAASLMGGSRNRASSAIQCLRTSLFYVNHGAENINPHYDDVHITQLEPSEINNPSNLPHLAQAGELMHLTFRSTAYRSHVVHWFYSRISHGWRAHKYNEGCPDPRAGDASALRERAIKFSFGPSLADFIVFKPAKKKKGKGPGSGSPSSSVPAPASSSARPLLPPPPLAAAAAPLPRLAMSASQNLPWRWDEDYGRGSAAPAVAHVPVPAPSLPVARMPPIGPAGLNAAADPAVPGFRRGGSAFGPVGPIGPAGLNAAADPIVPGFGRGGSPAGPIGPPRRP
jgi:hypothetical protein